MKKYKGLLITLEGTEGCGKTTQTRLLYDYLKGKKKKVVCFREPGSTKLSEKLRVLLLSYKNLEISPLSETLLYQASRAQFTAEKLLPALKKGYIVLLDRFTDATVAYQGYGEGVDLKLIDEINKIVTAGIKPDITFLFDIKVEAGLKRVRGSKDRMECKPIAFHRRVREGYLRLAKNEKRIRVIDSTAPIEEIQKKIREDILNAIAKRNI